jgi:aspartyl-tRNA(Asn)/glutamyl-tRNA(Gln) amidotransferase subunit A
VGLKSTYGAVSRFGLVAYASSLECIGVLSDTVARSRDVFSIIKGGDPLDETSRDAPASSLGKKAGKTIGVLSPEAVAKAVAASVSGSDISDAASAACLDVETKRGFDLACERVRSLGYTLREIEIPSLKYGVPAYYTIATAEASANLARFDGIRYGKRPLRAENPDDLIDQTRESGFGSEVKLRILLGTYVLRSGFQDRYYLRAQRIRSSIRAEFEGLLGDADYRDEGCLDAILAPVFPTRAFDRGPQTLSPFAQKAADLYTCCANLAGLPALSFPASLESDGSGLALPVGVQLIGRAFAEDKLFDIAEDYERENPFPHPPAYKKWWD